ncbi:hypothetical protein B7463_g8861, partial [Scytalidium lignicola]
MEYPNRNLEATITTTNNGNEDVEKKSINTNVPSLSPEIESKHPPDQNYVVDWDGEDDPANPLNWPSKRKVLSLAFISLFTFITPLASSMFAPGVPELMQDFQSTNLELASFVVSVYILGFAIGPILIAPLSELYGRQILYRTCNVLFLAFTVICGESQNIGMFIAFRFLAGCAGVAPITIGGGSVADVMKPNQRGGPIAGGYLVEAAGWRWVFRILAIASAVATLGGFASEETYAPKLLEAKAKKLRLDKGDQAYVSKFARNFPSSVLIKRAVLRPLKLLFTSATVFLLSLHVAIVYSYLYLLFTTFTVVFEGQYHFSTGSVGLSYLGLGIGCILGAVFLGLASDRIYTYLEKASGVAKPEFRLPLMIVFSLFVPIGLFWYGWTADKHVHWIVPIIATSVIAIGMLSVFLPVQTYLIDAFPEYAASAIAAVTVFRSIAGALVPLAGQPMFDRLGLGWGSSLLGFLALAMTPIPWVFWKFGERIRTKFPVDLD